MQEQHDLDIRKHFAALWRWKWLIVLTALLAAGVTYQVAPRPEPMYEATTVLRLQGPDPVLQALSQAGRPTTTGRSLTQVELVTSRPVLEEAARTLLRDPDPHPAVLAAKIQELRQRVVGVPIEPLGIVEVRARAHTSEEAVEVANVVANAYMRHLGQERARQTAESLNAISRLLAQLQREQRATPVLDPFVLGTMEDELTAAAASLERLAEAVGPSGSLSLYGASEASQAFSSLIARVQAANQQLEMLDSALAELVQGTPQGSQAYILLQALRDQVSTVSGSLLVAEGQLELGLLSDGRFSQQRLRAAQDQLRAAQVTLGLVSQQLSSHRASVTNSYRYGLLLTAEGTAQTIATSLGEVRASLETLLERLLDMEAQQGRVQAFQARIASAAAALAGVARRLEELSAGAQGQDTGAVLRSLTQEARGVSVSLDLLARQMEQFRTSQALQASAPDLAVWEERVRVVAGTLAEVRAQIDAALQQSLSDPSMYTQLLTLERQLQLSRLLSNVAQVEVAEPALSGRLVSARSPLQVTLLGAAAGLLLGVLGALVLDQMDTRLRTPADVKRFLEVPVMAAVPQTRMRRRVRPYLVNAVSRDRFSEAFRMLAARMEMASDEAPLRVALVSSVRRGEGKSIVAANLASFLAQAGRRVLLVDWDTETRGLTRQLQLEQQPGLLNILAGRSTLEQCVVREESFDVLPAGEGSAGIATSSLHRAREVLGEARQRYDFVIVDGADALGSADMMVLAREADGVCLVVRPHKTDGELARTVKETLESSGARILGVVLNNGAARRFLWRTLPSRGPQLRTKAQPAS